MRNRISLAALLLTVPAFMAAQGPVNVGSLTFAPATNVAAIDADTMKGQPSKLAWSPDGSQLYVQMMDGQFGVPGAKYSHHLYKVRGGQHEEVPAEPEWLSAYWAAKSGQASPDTPAFTIALKEEVRNEKTTSAPMGGDLARGGTSGGTGGAIPTDAIAAAYGQQAVKVVSMVLHDQLIGEYINAPIVPGQTFGWGPKGSKVMAYAAQGNGRLIVMDETGRRQEIDDTRDALFPAWSPDGSRLAWLEKDGKKKYVLKISTIGR